MELPLLEIGCWLIAVDRAAWGRQDAIRAAPHSARVTLKHQVVVAHRDGPPPVAQPVNQIDPSGRIDIFVGLEIDLVGINGLEFGGGSVLDTDHLGESGFFVNGGRVF